MRKKLPVGAISGRGIDGIEWYVGRQDGTAVAHFERGEEVLVDDLDLGWMPAEAHLSQTIRSTESLIDELVDFVYELKELEK